MKKILICLLFLATMQFNCSKTSETTPGDSTCGTYKSGQQLYKGPDGGCYYYNSNNNKTYVDRSNCTCK
ncbi:hypothetical protein ACFGVR_14920 [Mucilaginibacter sp. AW1-3]